MKNNNKPGRTVTMRDVAEAAGVSIMTVSRAFKPGGLAKEGTRARVLKAADELGYVFDRSASNLRTQRSNFVAVIIPSVNNANFAATVRGLSDTVESSGRQILLGNSNYDVQREERLVDELLQRRPDAIVLTGGRHTQRARSKLHDVGIPVVETWDLPAEPIDHVVGFSNAAAIDMMVEHLTQTGRTRIAFIGGDASEDTRGADRRRGFIHAMKTRGLNNARLVDVGGPPATMRSGADAMAHILSMYPDTDGVIGVSDLAAFGALTECLRRNLPVPKQISVAGFGAYDIASICFPTLTTIDVQPGIIGQQAGRIILDMLDGKRDRFVPQKFEVDTRLLLGASTSD